ncbi:MAG: SagB family peptide dehydrogenase [gamma proteobacterium symbiont of Bathyaustriella thionipta]|nr:SagB family peptide dehydrogenase [gamma proteobacterium symbiont of Bathyaustriella thionipta]MCU7948977.1 SagB family peptide dehydrogenase [gamma proteobacterium symbiont of Bathyaustriella thionipta]MCU7953441.1 SagB family peptide dehydrogenase [gamma proteobacterium symbiont of Bathyaustriella thionipta]MCU7955541.1 SagB family peptide dehydrogenase [gamma proteobacterium symbiont of Bathyaustriella thionipta]MCU7967413.1 SagB family peptide dehydrogenase [gamma proteobacterium symbion
MPVESALQTILLYHQQTKHHFQRYASGPDGLDWKNQPEAFRTFEGCAELELPLLVQPTSVSYKDLYHPEKNACQALTLTNIAQLLELSLGLSAWKQYDNTRWALRCNPSSGNLHPTESYIITEDLEEISEGVYHYVSRDHILEKRCQFSLKKSILPDNSFLIGLSSIPWREAWKYGERAFRYCQLDTGHAMSSICYAAATLGWQAHIVTSVSDTDVATLLGLDRDADFTAAEREYPDVMLLITTQKTDLDDKPFVLKNISLKEIVEQACKGRWSGQANVLSAHHLDDWPIISEAVQACIKPETDELSWCAPALAEPVLESVSDKPASTIIKQRRSAQGFDVSACLTKSLLTKQMLYRMLDLTLSRQTIPPCDVMPWQSRIHLLIFIHQVDGLEPGLYCFLRTDDIENKLKASLQQDYEWLKPEDCPEHLQLFRLIVGDAREAAKTLSCHQDIAGDGVISFGMIAEYQAHLTHKPWTYRQLFWEAGLIVQVFYLEAETIGLRGTGIGCYFDDGVHNLIGLNEGDYTFQSLYHFTLGKALTDCRLQTLPPYDHLQRSEQK